MRRTAKYPDTDTFRYYNANPHNRINGDCVPRAISIFLGIPWETCVREMTECGLEKGLVFNDPKCITLYLGRKGYHKQPMPRKEDNTKYTGGEFCKALAMPSKRYLLSMANHLTCVSEKRIMDVWDCSGKCVGNYWIK